MPKIDTDSILEFQMKFFSEKIEKNLDSKVSIDNESSFKEHNFNDAINKPISLAYGWIHEADNAIL